MTTIDASILFNELLAEAETRFGPRSRTLAPIVEPRDHLIPETIPNGADGCIVYYAREAQHDHLRLGFQLAHEAIHVLSGALKRDARNLEEGFAVWFSLHHRGMNRKSRRREEVCLSPLFKNTLKLFSEMNPTDRKIKELRSECADLDNAGPDHLIKIFSVSAEHAQKILGRVPIEMHARLA